MKKLCEMIMSLGFNNVKEISTEELPFQPSLIELCEMNTCGNYGRNYKCPPLVGKTEDLIQEAKSYKKALVFQKIYSIEDSFDIEGMGLAKDDFGKCVQQVNNFCKENIDTYLVLGAGGCTLCKTCGVITNEPCRYPNDAIASLESYGLFVSELASVCGMKYINGVNTVTYFGAVLYN